MQHRPDQAWRAVPGQRGAMCPSLAERLDHQAGRCGARILLLPRDQPAITDRVRFEAAGDDEVGVLDTSCLVLDPEGLDAPADELVGVLLLRVGEARPGLPLDEQAAVREPRLQQRTGAVADDGGWLTGLVEGPDQLVHC